MASDCTVVCAHCRGSIGQHQCQIHMRDRHPQLPFKVFRNMVGKRLPSAVFVEAGQLEVFCEDASKVQEDEWAKVTHKFTLLSKNQVFICRFCGFESPSFAQLEGHVYPQHFSLAPYACGYCGQSLVSLECALFHLLASHTGQPLQVLYRKPPELTADDISSALLGENLDKSSLLSPTAEVSEIASSSAVTSTTPRIANQQQSLVQSHISPRRSSNSTINRSRASSSNVSTDELEQVQINVQEYVHEGKTIHVYAKSKASHILHCKKCSFEHRIVPKFYSHLAEHLDYGRFFCNHCNKRGMAKYLIPHEPKCPKKNIKEIEFDAEKEEQLTTMYTVLPLVSESKEATGKKESHKTPAKAETSNSASSPKSTPKSPSKSSKSNASPARQSKATTSATKAKATPKLASPTLQLEKVSPEAVKRKGKTEAAKKKEAAEAAKKKEAAEAAKKKEATEAAKKKEAAEAAKKKEAAEAAKKKEAAEAAKKKEAAEAAKKKEAAEAAKKKEAADAEKKKEATEATKKKEMADNSNKKDFHLSTDETVRFQNLMEYRFQGKVICVKPREHAQHILRCKECVFFTHIPSIMYRHVCKLHMQYGRFMCVTCQKSELLQSHLLRQCVCPSGTRAIINTAEQIKENKMQTYFDAQTQAQEQQPVVVVEVVVSSDTEETDDKSNSSGTTASADRPQDMLAVSLKSGLQVQVNWFTKSIYTFRCDQCSFETDCVADMYSHLCSQHLRYGRYTCTYCRKMFFFKEEFDKHRELGTGVGHKMAPFINTSNQQQEKALTGMFTVLEPKNVNSKTGPRAAAGIQPKKEEEPDGLEFAKRNRTVDSSDSENEPKVKKSRPCPKSKKAQVVKADASATTEAKEEPMPDDKPIVRTSIYTQPLNEFTFDNKNVTVSGDGYEFECLMCELESNDLEFMYRHIARHNTYGRYACSACFRTYFTEKLFKRHVLRVKECADNDATSLYAPLEEQEKKLQDMLGVISMPQGKLRFDCKHCAVKTYRRSKIKSHVAVHLGVFLYKCQQCGENLKSPSLKKHQEDDGCLSEELQPIVGADKTELENLYTYHVIPHGVKDSPMSSPKKEFHTYGKIILGNMSLASYRCKTCQLEFPNRDGMEVHYATSHLLYHRYRCSECEMKSFFKSDVSSHLESEAGNEIHGVEATVVDIKDPDLEERLQSEIDDMVLPDTVMEDSEEAPDISFEAESVTSTWSIASVRGGDDVQAPVLSSVSPARPLQQLEERSSPTKECSARRILAPTVFETTDANSTRDNHFGRHLMDGLNGNLTGADLNIQTTPPYPN